jgi:hypothetical protein
VQYLQLLLFIYTYFVVSGLPHPLGPFFFEDAIPEDSTTALGLTAPHPKVPTMAEEKEDPATPTGAAADKAPPAKLSYAGALRARVAAAVNGRLDAAHRQLRGQELLLLTLLCLCCTLLCVFVTHRQGG